eukprot:CAMPEP_0167772070 /NCGR_PEP_ID=MMETSP0111_2-20121227/638_1 /TAXON_ID=91324 /ORGANISM="Lotharella globosa, Strain CCCM811" /LENGTH=46 /DNA_ID= /DNA_START= /DNA_END= /DNA_ORIENTATION=
MGRDGIEPGLKVHDTTGPSHVGGEGTSTGVMVPVCVKARDNDHHLW